METRTITLTLDKAKEWYNSGNANLKEIALQAFTKEELEAKNFECIKTFDDVLEALEISKETFFGRRVLLTKGQMAMVKLNLIRKVLNAGQKMPLTKGNIYYPQIRFVTKNGRYYNDELKSGYMVKAGTIKQNCGEYYNVLGGYANDGDYAGLGYFNSYAGVGTADAYFGFLGCATSDIARHMSLFFAKEIFDAMYADFIDYTWID